MFGWSFGALLKALGEVAFKSVGKGANDVASGDDSRIVSALQKGNNLSDVTNKLSSATNIDALPWRGNLHSTNLNTIGHVGAVGFYYQPDSRNMDLGYPENGSAGSLLVKRCGAVSTAQVFIHWNNRKTWTRNWTGQAWTPWVLSLKDYDNLSSVSDKLSAINNLGGYRFMGPLGKTNLNSLDGTKYGVYLQSADSNTPNNNYPNGRSGVLRVMQNYANGDGGCVQEYLTFTGETFYRLYKPNIPAWTTWTRQLEDANNLGEVQDKETARRNLDIYRSVYPVGTVLMFDSNTNPNSVFNNTVWTEIRDGRIIRSSPDGSTGNIGSDSFTLTEANIPKHTHTVAGNVGANGNHTHWDGYNAPGNSPWDERLPNESSWDAAVRLTGRGYETSGTDNQGQHDRRRTTVAGSHSHPISITCSEAYSGATQAVNFPMTSKYYRVWKRTA